MEILEGDYEGILMEIDYGQRQILSGNVYLNSGDRILVTLGKRPDGVITAYYAEHVRTTPLLRVGRDGADGPRENESWRLLWSATTAVLGPVSYPKRIRIWRWTSRRVQVPREPSMIRGS